MKKLLFVLNPHSGRAQIKNHMLDILDIFTKNGYCATVYPTQAPLDAYKIIMERAKDFDLAVVSGGDGTLHEAVRGIMEYPENERVPVGYIPAGTVNDFAASLNISKDMLEAAEKAVTGSPFDCDICEFNGSAFNYVAAFGAFTDVPYDTSQESKNFFGQIAYWLEGMKRLPSLTTYHVRVTIGDRVIEDDFALGIVLNSISVAGIRDLSIFADSTLDDGLFEVGLIKMPANILQLQSVLFNLAQGKKDADGYMVIRAHEARFEFDEDVKWTLDGEFGGACKKADIRVLDKAVKFIV